MGIIKTVVTEVTRSMLEDRAQARRQCYNGGYSDGYRQGVADRSIPPTTMYRDHGYADTSATPTTVNRDRGYADDTKRSMGPLAPALAANDLPLYDDIDPAPSLLRDVGAGRHHGHASGYSDSGQPPPMERVIIREPMVAADNDRRPSPSQLVDGDGGYVPSRAERRQARKYERKLLKEEEKHERKMARHRRKRSPG